MACLWCKTANIIDKTCPNCGKFFYSDQELEAVVGSSYGHRVRILFSLTDRYIIIHKAKHFEQSQNGLGLIGGAVAAAVVTTAKEGKMPYGFYGLHEIREAIYPYHNKKFKKGVAIKLIFKDSSELILDRWDVPMMTRISEELSRCGVKVINGSGMQHGDVFCTKPLVTDDTIGLRVCAEIAPHVKMMKGNFVAPSMMGGAAPQVQNTAPIQPKVTVRQTQPAQPMQTPSSLQQTAAAPRTLQTINELNLRVKTYNELMRLGVDRIEELTICSREALLVNGLSEQSVQEIEERLRVNGLSLKKKQPAVRPQPQTPAKPVLVDDLKLDIMTFAQLFELGINRVDVLLTLSREDLINKGVTLAAIAEVEAKLAAHGLALAPCVPAPQSVPAPEQSKDAFSSLNDMELSVEGFNQVFGAGFNRVLAIAACTREELLAKGISPEHVNEVEACLKSHGLSLAEAEPAQEPPMQEIEPAAKPEVFETAFGMAQPVQPDSIFTVSEAPAESEPAVPAQEPEQPSMAIPKRDPNVKFCRRCGAKLRRSDIFCVECGMDQR